MIYDYKTRLAFRQIIAPRMYWLRFSLIDPQTIEFVPGQYLLLKVGDALRQFSILDYSEKEKTFDLLIEYIAGGIASEYIARLEVGDSVEFTGPAGIFVQKDVVRPNIYFATGSGIAPILPMIRQTIQKNSSQPILLYWGLPKKEDVYFDQVLSELGKESPQFKYVICLSREDESNAIPYVGGRIQKNINTILPAGVEITDCDVYICGGKEMVEDMKEFVISSGVPKSQLHFERFN